MTKLENDPNGFERLIMDVAVARSRSENQLLAIILIELVTIGPDDATTACPNTTHQKLSFTCAKLRSHAPEIIIMAAILSTVRLSNRLNNNVDRMKAGRKTAALQLTARLTSNSEILKAVLIWFVIADIATDVIHCSQFSKNYATRTSHLFGYSTYSVLASYGDISVCWVSSESFSGFI